jgi:hypothetical protein
MRVLRFTLLALLIGLPISMQAAVSPKNVPAAAVWYFHADFVAMRSGEAGSSLYKWLDDEVFEEIRDEIGVDLSKEADQITAFAAPDSGIVIIFDGEISQDSQDKMLAMATLSGGMESFEADDKQYYFVSNDDDDDAVINSDSMDIDSLEDSAYVSFALKNKVIVTSSQDKMISLLENDGNVKVSASKGGALLVLSADRSLMQAGMIADEFDYDDDWDSAILKNAKQVALLVSDEGDKLAVEAQLVTTEPEMASSLASIARGLISLQVFSPDLDDELKGLLSGTSVDVDGNSLVIRVAVDPEIVVAAISD